ncbi:MAG: hypothetical protein ACI84C_000929, partial [Flavobacteriales bacterium]
MKNAIVQLLSLLFLTAGTLSAQYTPFGTESYPSSSIETTDDTPDQISSNNGVSYTPMSFPNAVNSVQSGDWNAPGTWDCGCIPNFQDDVNILAGHFITQNLDVQLANLDINAGGQLTVGSGDLTFEITGDWTNSGEFIASDGTVTFNGSGDQNIFGLCTFYNMTLN